jgi:hypothetical protein
MLNIERPDREKWREVYRLNPRCFDIASRIIALFPPGG